MEFRVEATGGWTMKPYNLTLVVIVKAGAVPAVDDDVDCPQDLLRWLRTADGSLRRSSGEIANRLYAHALTSRGTAPIPEEKYFLWGALTEAWAARCKPRANDAQVAGVVAGEAIVGELASDDEYTLARYRRSEQLDVDHLSPPTPR